ncbi:alpha/beta hydrolase [Nocardioides sp. Kera G14]|uniref:alpha/beta hydrolase n=1 Tax=Nocardioides sp. Kera G14 TaxID=2884264 RepID=UPI001D10D71A|nr:alpha/beta hydrolase [Nocardioides sp. Kera G14]UDY22778.1 alpha/beta hydrolase [Nocardioides sp. Kera G14]
MSTRPDGRSVPSHVDADDYQQTLEDREAGRREIEREVKEEVAWVEDLDASGVLARLYVPAGMDDRTPYERGLIVHFHGGGFVFNDVEIHDAPARRLANRTGRSVLSVDYRLAPEHPFPAAVEDTDHALAWAASRTTQVFAHGDSAGGNLALVGALRNPGLVTAVVLVYPFLDPASAFPSYDAADWTWDRDEAQWYWSQYLADPSLAMHPDVAPLRSERLADLPPTLVITAAEDIARDEGEHLVGVLQEKGVDAVGTRYLNVPHGFWRGSDHAQANDLAMRQTGAFLDRIVHLSSKA